MVCRDRGCEGIDNPKPCPSASGTDRLAALRFTLPWTYLELPDSAFAELCLLIATPSAPWNTWELESVFQARLKGAVLRQMFRDHPCIDPVCFFPVPVLWGFRQALGFSAPHGCEGPFPTLPSRHCTFRHNLITVSQRRYWSYFTDHGTEAPRGYVACQKSWERTRELPTPAV